MIFTEEEQDGVSGSTPIRHSKSRVTGMMDYDPYRVARARRDGSHIKQTPQFKSFGPDCRVACTQ